MHGAQNKALTVRMLLTMRSDKLITVFEEKGNTDWIKSYFAAPFLAPPDTRFNYISENTFMLSAIVSKVTGMSMVDYLYPRMFQPLGIEKPFWEADGRGNNVGGWGLYMKSEDLAKFFLPYLHGGKYKDGTHWCLPIGWRRLRPSRPLQCLTVILTICAATVSSFGAIRCPTATAATAFSVSAASSCRSMTL